MSLSHPSMKKGGNTNPMPVKPQPLTNYIVEDASDLDSQIQQFEESQQQERPLMPPARVFESAKETTTPKKPTVNEETRKKIESIVFLGRLTKIVEIAGQKFELGTLTNLEQNEMLGELYGFGEGADLFKIRTLSLANALKNINGVKLDELDVFSDEDEQNFISPYKRRQAIVDNMQLALVERLYDEYSKLVMESDSIIKGQEIKNNRGALASAPLESL